LIYYKSIAIKLLFYNQVSEAADSRVGSRKETMISDHAFFAVPWNSCSLFCRLYLSCFDIFKLWRLLFFAVWLLSVLGLLGVLTPV